MKFGLFYQLPCAPTQAAATRYQETIEQIVYAEELGFDTAWLAELHFNPLFSVMPAPLILAGAVAQRTRRIRLGTAVLLLPLQHPLRTAEEAAVVDLLSQGRLELGVGRGMIAIHFQGFNVPREESRARFEEALTIIKQAWTQETCRFAGKYFHVPETAVVPKPLQRPPPQRGGRGDRLPRLRRRQRRAGPPGSGDELPELFPCHQSPGAPGRARR